MFKEAYKAGLEAAELADKNIEEIDAVFNELDAEISSLNEGKIRVIRGIAEREKAGLIAILRPLNTPIPYQAIIAKNSKTSKEEAIAEYEIDRQGYPIRLKWADREESCFTKEALKATIEEILADPATGKAFQKLLAEKI